MRPRSSSPPTATTVTAAGMDSPWQTLRFAVQQLRAGDTLYLRGGVYTGGDNVIDSQAYPVASGSLWGDAITVAGYPGESVTMLPPNFASGIKMTHGSPWSWIFQDFVVDMSNQSYGTGMGATAVYVADGANHIRLLRMEVKNNQGNGVGFSNSNGNSAFNEVINSSIHDNGRFPGVNMGYGYSSIRQQYHRRQRDLQQRRLRPALLRQQRSARGQPQRDPQQSHLRQRHARRHQLRDCHRMGKRQCRRRQHHRGQPRRHSGLHRQLQHAGDQQPHLG